MTQHYSNPERANDPHAIPNIEVFYMDGTDYVDTHGDGPKPGWYWHPCFPGCLPDGEPSGPFETEEKALADAQDDEGSTAQ